MFLIFESQNFLVEAPQKLKVHVDRLDGGHIKISPKVPVAERTDLSIEQAHELIVLSMIVGEAFTIAMKRVGIVLGTINYQDNGNFNKTFHLHLYGRAINAPVQKFGTVLQFPATQEEFVEAIKKNEPLTNEDIVEIQNKIEYLLKTDKYKNRI